MRIEYLSDIITSESGEAGNFAIKFIKIDVAYSETTDSMKPVSSDNEKKASNLKKEETKAKIEVTDAEVDAVKESSLYKSNEFRKKVTSLVGDLAL